MNRLLGFFRAARRGSVLMEYLVVNLAVAVPIVMFWHLEMFNPSENKWERENRVGTRIQWMFQRVSSGIALPVP